MAGPLSLRRRATTAARWPLGIGLTSWRYMWRTTPMSRSESAGDPAQDAPPPLPEGTDMRDLQGPELGVGPLFHRRYQMRVRDAAVPPNELMDRLRGDLDEFAPSEFASFQKVAGESQGMRVGDEYLVRMPGPWDGPVRVVEVTPRSFRLATLEGHLEAGQIEFRADGGEANIFTIESWARSGDRLSNLLYSHARMAKEVQLHMWSSVLERLVERSGGRREGRLEIVTRHLKGEEPTERLVRSPRKRRALAALDGAALNFERSASEGHRPANGWHVDRWRQELPPEPPGAPVPDGPWELARRLMRGYEFADPSIVRAFYDPEAPLEGRNMLLELRFWGLRFRVGVRVTRVYDEMRTLDGRDARVWGWTYATLDGHLERGEMSWEVRKWSDSGAVEFALEAYSQRAEIRNPLVRVGFAVFGRREQLRFYESTCGRMRRLTEAALRDGSRGDAVRRTTEDVTARSASRAAAAHDEVVRNVAGRSGDSGAVPTQE